MNLIWGALPVLIVCWILVETRKSDRRVQSLRTAARLHHWEWLGRELPRDFPLQLVADVGDRPNRAENTFRGQKNHLSFLACDCVIDQGEDEQRFTIVAAHTDKNPFGAEKFSNDLSVIEKAGWFAIQRSTQMIGFGTVPGDRLFSADEILGHIGSLGD